MDPASRRQSNFTIDLESGYVFDRADAPVSELPEGNDPHRNSVGFTATNGERYAAAPVADERGWQVWAVQHSQQGLHWVEENRETIVNGVKAAAQLLQSGGKIISGNAESPQWQYFGNVMTVAGAVLGGAAKIENIQRYGTSAYKTYGDEHANWQKDAAKAGAQMVGVAAEIAGGVYQYQGYETNTQLTGQGLGHLGTASDVFATGESEQDRRDRVTQETTHYEMHAGATVPGDPQQGERPSAGTGTVEFSTPDYGTPTPGLHRVDTNVDPYSQPLGLTQSGHSVYSTGSIAGQQYGAPVRRTTAVAGTLPTIQAGYEYPTASATTPAGGQDSHGGAKKVKRSH